MALQNAPGARLKAVSERLTGVDRNHRMVKPRPAGNFGNQEKEGASEHIFARMFSSCFFSLLERQSTIF